MCMMMQKGGLRFMLSRIVPRTVSFSRQHCCYRDNFLSPSLPSWSQGSIKRTLPLHGIFKMIFVCNVFVGRTP